MPAVIGYEGQSCGDFLRPQLASIFADNRALGRVAATVLLDRLGRKKSHPTVANHRKNIPLSEALSPKELKQVEAAARKYYAAK